MSHTCPRRGESIFIPAKYHMTSEETTEGPDTYESGRGLVNGIFPGCSYCGSVSGDDFMQYVRDGGTVGGTDKRYKAYLERDTGTPVETEDEHDNEGRLTRSAVREGTGTMHSKFYYMHLTREQQQEFIEIWNRGDLSHSIYRDPFFVVAAP